MKIDDMVLSAQNPLWYQACFRRLWLDIWYFFAGTMVVMHGSIVIGTLA